MDGVAIQGTDTIRLVPDNEKSNGKDKEKDDQKNDESGNGKGK